MNQPGQIVVLGCRGMLGTDLTDALCQRGLAFRGFDLPEFDITDGLQVEQAMENACLVVNCAAYTDVEKAESEKETAFCINAAAVGGLGGLAAKHDIPVLHISTDFVFDGTLDRPYAEDDPANPVSVYGASKLEGEKRLRASGCRDCIVRVQGTYGRAGNNFVKKLLGAAKTKKNLRVVDDQLGSPTATAEAAAVLCDMIQLKPFPQGLFHLAAQGCTSRYEMASFIFDATRADVNIEPCKTSDYPSKAARPLNSRFNCDKLCALLGKKMRPWREPLAEFLEQL